MDDRTGSPEPIPRLPKTGPNSVALLHKPETGAWGRWTCPNSLRETEPSVNLIVDDADPYGGTAPMFQPMPPPPPPKPGAENAALPTAVTLEAADTEDTDADAFLAGARDED